MRARFDGPVTYASLPFEGVGWAPFESQRIIMVMVAAAGARRGRPRNERAHRAILEAFQAQLVEHGFADLHLEHVAARAGVGKATIYRRWASREALALELLEQLAAPHIAIDDCGDTAAELLAAVTNALRAVTETPFGPVIRALLSQIASNPVLGDPFRASVVQARRDEIGRVVARGIARGDLRRDVDVELATELLVGPVYFRLLFGGELNQAVAERIVAAVLAGYGAPGQHVPTRHDRRGRHRLLGPTGRAGAGS